jgi:AraC-like DNA-binding protein
VSASAGYFDQAHFIKGFRKMTGGVPRGYRGYFPAEVPTDFAPNVVVFVQDVQGASSSTMACSTHGDPKGERHGR